MALDITTVKKSDRQALLLAASIYGLCCFLLSGPVQAQDVGQQLSDQAAQAQVPSSFPDPEAVPATPVETKNPIDQLSQDQSATAPAQPEQQKLVPATPMGAAAQSADNGQGGATPSADAAATAQAPGSDAPVAAQPATQAPASTEDILEKYTQKAEAADQARNVVDPESAAADALPPSTLTGVKVRGLDFDDSNRVVSVGTDEVEQAQKTPEELQEEIRTEAFDAALTGMFPLSPDQIKSLLQRYDETQKVTQTPVYQAPKPEVSVQNISLDPGVAPAVIKTALGNVTTLNILDATGAPWPVQDVTWAGDYEIVEPEEGGHIIRITPMSDYARGNIVIRLLTLKTPVSMTLETGRDIVQYRVDARIPEYGPFASTPIIQGGKSLVAGSPDLTSILDGVMPNGAMKLSVSGVDGRTTAYSLGGVTYVRTPLTLLSPAWQSSVSSADGMNVYALSNAPVLLLSDGGAFERATLSEKKDLLDE